MYDTIFTLDETFTAIPNLIKSYETDDGKCWKFHANLSQILDGTTLTATDVSYSVQRAMHSPQFSSRLKGIVGASAMDDSLFVINLYETDMQFPTLLDIPVIKNGTIEDYSPMGTGPYMPDEGYTKLSAFADHKKCSVTSKLTRFI